jgi:hypothetical protein
MTVKKKPSGRPDEATHGRLWLAKRMPDTVQGRRLRTLFRSFIAPLNADDPIAEAAALACAELVVSAEEARAKLLAGKDPLAEQAVVRLENTARRAKLDLVALTPKPLNWFEQQALEREQEESANGEDE